MFTTRNTTIRNALFSGLLIVCMTASQAAAFGDCDRKANGSGNWCDGATWLCWNVSQNDWISCSHPDFRFDECFETPIPDCAGCDVFIFAGDTVTIAEGASGCNVQVGEVDIASHATTPGILQLNAYTTNATGLTIKSNGGLSMNTLGAADGRIVFFKDTGGDTAATLTIDANNSIAGDVQTSGGEAEAGILDAGTSVFTLTTNGEITVPSGGLKIDGDFLNNGTIDVSAGYTVEFTGAGPNVNSCGLFKLNHASGRILINTTADVDMTDSGAEFDIFLGKLDLDQSLSFDGELTWTGGNIDAAASETAAFD